MDPILEAFCHSGPPAALEKAINSKEKIENSLTIGILLSQYKLKDKNLSVVKTLYKIASSQNLDPSTRGIILCRLLQLFSDWAKNQKDGNRTRPEMTKDIIEQFSNASNLFTEIKSRIDRKMGELIARAYNSVINSLFELMKLNEEIIKIVKICLAHKEFLAVESNILTLDPIDVDILANENSDVAAVLGSLRKGCSIILEKGIRGGDLLSIFTFNTLYLTLDKSIDERHSALLPHIERNLKEFENNFTPKQKSRLLESYTKICHMLQSRPDEKLINIYEGNYKEPRVSFKEEENKKTIENVKEEEKMPQEEIKPEKTNKKKGKKLEVPGMPYKEQEPRQSKKNKEETIGKSIEKLLKEVNTSVENEIFVQADELGDRLAEIASRSESGEQEVFAALDAALGSTKPREKTMLAWRVIVKAVNRTHFLSEYNERAINDKLDAWLGKVQSNKLKESYKRDNRQEKKRKEQEGVEEEKREKKKPAYVKKKLEEKAQKSKAEIEKLVEKVEDSAMNLIDKYAPKQEHLNIIKQITEGIKNIVNRVLPGSEIKGIGSTSAGIWTIASDIDLTVLNPSIGNPQNALQTIKSALLATNPDLEIKETANCLQIKDPQYPNHFNLSINDIIGLEITSLAKKYCSLDSLVTELILFVKIWARAKGLSSIIKNYHWSFLVLGFLQTINPPLLNSLQNKPHEPKFVGGYDVWFDTDVKTSNNTQYSLGYLIFNFFDYFANEYKDGKFDIKNGLLINEPSEGLFTVIHPITRNEIGAGLAKSSPRAEEVRRKIMETYEAITRRGELEIA